MAVDAEGRWIAGIGDPSMVGWITVAAYAVAAGLAARNAIAAQRALMPSSFWVALAALLLLLGVNKQLDLQTWFGQTGRDMALAQGWYDQRRAVQAGFIVLLCVAAAVLTMVARRQWRARWREYRFAFGGVCLLMVFIIIRAASFHHTDEMIGISLGVTTAGRSLEIVGVTVIAWACARWRALQRPRSS